MATGKTHCCPICGNDEGIYGRADGRWDRESREWIATYRKGLFECLECGSTFTEAEFNAGTV